MPLSNRRLLALIGIQNEIAASDLDLHAVIDLVARRAAEIGHATGSIIALPDGSELACMAAAGTARASVAMHLKVASILSGRCFRTGKVYISNDTEKDKRVDVAASRLAGIRSMVCAPLIHRNQTVGVLTVVSARPNTFRSHDAAFINLLAGIVAARMSQATTFEKKTRESRTDALTGLPDRNAFEERLRAHVERQNRYGRPFTLVVFDLDNFVEINDIYGHAAGDEILLCVAMITRLQSRQSDECFRIGGDQFAVIMPETQKENARPLASRIARGIGAAQIGHAKLTVCHGVSQADGGDAKTVLASAAQALDELKVSRKRMRAGAPHAG